VTSVPSQQDPARVVAQSVVMDDLGPDWAGRLADSCTVTAVDKLDDQPDALAQAQGLLLGGSARVGQRILDLSPQLQVVALRSVGYDQVDIGASAACGVTVSNAPGVLESAVANHTILLLAAARRLQPNIALARSGENWLRNAVLGADVRAKTLGLVGMGRIPTLVARSAQAGFGMNVLYRTRGERPAAPGRAVGAEGGLVLRCRSGEPRSFELARVS